MTIVFPERLTWSVVDTSSRDRRLPVNREVRTGTNDFIAGFSHDQENEAVSAESIAITPYRREFGIAETRRSHRPEVVTAMCVLPNWRGDPRRPGWERPHLEPFSTFC